jgi:anti-sigma regulatory factor (Ser/Thr protein kinase)
VTNDLAAAVSPAALSDPVQKFFDSRRQSVRLAGEFTTVTIANHRGNPGYAVTMPCAEESAKPARLLVRIVLATWGLDDLADDSALVVTELVANAAKHTDTVLVRVSINRPEPDHVRVDVADRSPMLPVLRPTGTDDEGGRGLALVDALTSRWGTETLRKGKRVWGELKSETPA